MKENRLIYLAATPPTPSTPTPPTPPTPAEDEKRKRAHELNVIDADQQDEQLKHYSDRTLEELNKLSERVRPYSEDEGAVLITEMEEDIAQINEYNYYGKFLHRTLRNIETNSGFWMLPSDTEGKEENIQAFKDSLFHARKVLGVNVSTSSIDAVVTKKQATDIVRNMMRRVKEQKDKAERHFIDRVDSTLLGEIENIEKNYKNSPHKTEAMKKQVAAMREAIDLLRKIAGKSKSARIRVLTEYTNSNEYIHLGSPSEQVKELEKQVQTAPGIKEALIELKAYLLANGIKAGDVCNLRQVILGLLTKHISTESDAIKKKHLSSAKAKLEDMDESTRDMREFIIGYWYLISPKEYAVEMTHEELKSLDEEPDFTNDIAMRLQLMKTVHGRKSYSEEAKDDAKKSESIDTGSVEESYARLKAEKVAKVDPLMGAIKAKAQAMINRIDDELFPILEKEFKGEDKQELKTNYKEGLDDAKKSLEGWMNLDKTYQLMLEGPEGFDWKIDKDGNVVEDDESKNPGIAQYIDLASRPNASTAAKKGALLAATELMDTLRKSIDEPKDVLEKFMPEYNESISGYRDHLLDKTKQPLYKKYQIYFLSIQDFKHMGEKLVEWAKRRYNRRSDSHMGDFGTKLFKGLPGPLKTASNEFDRLKEHSELEEVEQYEGAYKNKDAWMITEKMETTKNQDEFKACIKLLCTHGRMRWESTKFWKQLMYFTHGAIQFNVNNPDSETIKKHMFEEKLSKAIGYIWDFDTYEKWVQENGTNATSEREKYNSYCDQTAESGGGIDGAMSTMLSSYKEEKKHGHIPKIDPHKYEKLIHYGIDKGKGTPESKLYFLIQGVACGLLPHSTLSKLSSLKINEYPVIDILGSETERGERPTPKDVKEWARMDWDLNKPGAVFHKWWYTKVLHTQKIYQRVNKALQQGLSQDHDDATGWFGAADVNTIQKMLSENATGLRMPPTGVQNGTVGMMQYLDNLIEFGNEMPLEGETGLYDQFARFAGSFSVFDGITSERMYKGHLNYFRWRGSEEREPRSTYLYGDSYGRGTEKADLAVKGKKTDRGFTSGIRTIDYVRTMREYITLFDEDYFNFLIGSSSTATKEEIAAIVDQTKKRYGNDRIFGEKDPIDVNELHLQTETFVKNAIRTPEGKRRFMAMRSVILQDHQALIKTVGMEKDCVHSRLAYIDSHKKELDDEIEGKGHGSKGHWRGSGLVAHNGGKHELLHDEGAIEDSGSR